MSSKHASSNSFIMARMKLMSVISFALIVLTTGQSARAEKLGAERPASSIVSLAPSNTELVYSLGAEDKLVGISSYCTYPPETKSKPKVGSFVSINWERLAKLKPDVVLLVQGQESLSFQLKKHQVRSVVLNNKSLDDISRNLILLGSVCGKSERAEKLATSFQNSIARLKETLKNEPRRKVFFCVWPKPIVTVGGDSFLNDVITTCGGTNIAADIKSGYPKFSPEKLIASQPDLLVMPFESRSSSLKTTPPWSLMTAVKENRVYHLPDREHDYLSRPTLQIFEGLYEFARRLHPERQIELRSWFDKSQTKFTVAKQTPMVRKPQN
ncbi:cobalamin-binding protein [Candidatus Obscuribacterales bacterium]|nr:cobalamin-binding protein [Candidatus Obscuribacterales bacterium]